MFIDNDFPKLLGAELYRPHPAYIVEMAAEPVVVHEHEVFTRVVLEVKKDGETNFKKYTFEVEGHDDHGHDDHGDDDHGDDDHGDEHTEVELDTNSTYHVSIFFYNDSDPDNIEDLSLIHI